MGVAAAIGVGHVLGLCVHCGGIFTGMASLEDHLREEADNQLGQDINDEPPPGVAPPVSDGLPQVSDERVGGREGH